MTTAQPHPIEPAFTLGDRLHKARTTAGLSQSELADVMGVSTRTVSRYEGDDLDRPRRIVLRAWALACGVSYDWLVTGARTATSDQGSSASACKHICADQAA